MNEHEQQPTPEERRDERNPQIYVASLSDYNAGILHGAWLEVSEDADELQEGIQTMLAASPTTARTGEPAEEWAIHDYEGWFELRLGEYEPIERLTRVAAGIAEHGEAFAAWAGNDPVATEDLNHFGDLYRGEWDSIEAYAEEVLEELGAYQEIEKLGDWFAAYVSIDVEAFARDIGMEMSVVENSSGRVFVFDPS